MRTTPIEPATLAFNAEGLPWSPRYGDVYHPRGGAFVQARHVFLGGNDLPARWQDPADPQRRFVILETGFGLGNNFLATWQAWRDTPGPRAPLDFISLEQHPFLAHDLRRAHAASPCPEQVEALLAQWPALTHNLHSLSFENGQVRLLLAFGDALQWLPELVASVDAFYLDGFARACNPMLWQDCVYKAMARLAAPGATAATWSAAHALRKGLTSAGFEVRLAAGSLGKREMTLARYAPRFTPRAAPRRTPARAAPTPRQALIVGGGLAGCATAWALARVGWHSTVLDTHPHPAAGASGNPAGLFHGIVTGQDGTHARLYRAAALAITQVVRDAVAQGTAGQAQGLLRLVQQRDGQAMRALIAAQGLPPSYVQALDAAQAGAAGGWSAPSGAWLFPGGGWVDPSGLCRAYLAWAGPAVQWRGGARVASITCSDPGEATCWTALDAEGRPLGQAPVLVLANAGDSLRLLSHPDWPMTPVRGQLSWCEHADQAIQMGWPPSGPTLPVAGAGYALPPWGLRRLFGATSQPGDMDPRPRLADHAANLQQWHRLQGHGPLDDETALAMARRLRLEGRVGWRWTTGDKLPLWGSVPETTWQGARQAVPLQVRHAARVPGLFVCTGLGSRGITWSALAGQVLAALVSDTVCPLESSLLDAVDPARFDVRRSRLETASRSTNR